MSFTIEATTEKLILAECAEMMSKTEPWITLQRDLAGCMEAMLGNYKEVYVARRNRELLGFIVLQMQGAFKGYIQSVCVSPDAQGAGVGTSLIQFAEKRIFLVSPNVFMLVSAFNTKAADLYFRLGYEKIGTLKNYAADGFDEFLLRKTIGSLKNFLKNQLYR
ncbi:MAG: GNAT family N-acetyltransferase [Bacteroidetes bacterium]|nr:GNAT family N-acetyltransferase [Bacteroidota bacterium]